MTVRKLALSITTCALLCAPGASFAIGNGTPDGSPPAEETVCEDAGLQGAAYGLCVAYCEASDCDDFPGSQACDRMHANYTKLTGDESFPCDEVTPPPTPALN